MKPHPQRMIPVKHKDVFGRHFWQDSPIDDDIIPVVNWLNSYDGIATIESCQGDAEHEAYVTFYCYTDSKASLLDIIKRTEHLPPGGFTTGIDVHTDIIYHTISGSLEKLLEICKEE